MGATSVRCSSPGKALSNHNLLLTLLIAMRPDVLDSWVMVKGEFSNAHPSQ
jgi:hypothetical protein